MNLNFSNSKKKVFFQKEKKIYPNTHWLIARSIFFSLVIASFAFGAFLLIKGKNELAEVEKSDIRANVESVKNDRINKILNLFSERKIKSEETINSNVQIADPGI